MGDTHLSELCRGDDEEVIMVQLRRLWTGTDAIDGASGNAAPHSPEDGAAGGNMLAYQDADGRTAFHWAVALKNFKLATTLMHTPYNSPVLTVDSENITPFLTACSVGASQEFLAELLERSVVEYPGFSLQKGKEETVLAGGKVEPPTDDTNVQQAIPDLKVPSLATPKICVVNIPDNLGMTPLIVAASRGHLQIVRWLLDVGADLDAQNSRGQTALHRAVSRGSSDLIELLVASSEKKNADHRAAHRRWMDLQDSHGESALFYASVDNNEEVGRYLLRHGADRELRNKKGKQFWEV